MTRKTALLKAISYIGQMEETEETEAVHTKLKEIFEDLPLTRWSEGTIFDTLEQWAEDNGRNPMVGDLRSKGLPPHPVIKLRFGVNAKEFLNKHFPQAEIPKEYWKDFFIGEYERQGRPVAEKYNRHRKNGTPSWATIAKLFDIGRWNDWLDFCGLEPKKSLPPDKRQKPYERKMKVQIHSHFLDEIERLWSKEKIKEFFPDLTCEVLPSEREDVRDVEEVLESIRQMRREFASEKR